MLSLVFIICMGILARLAGTGFGSKFGMSWLPELIFSIPFGVAAGTVANLLGCDLTVSLFITAISAAISYGGMQSATWMFLDWEGERAPNLNRKSTLKPIIDYIAKLMGYKLGDEGYAWVAAGVKGFIITLPVGGVIGTILWPLGYELGSHARGRVERFGLDPHMFSEFFSGCLGGVSIVLFVNLAYIIWG